MICRFVSRTTFDSNWIRIIQPLARIKTYIYSLQSCDKKMLNTILLRSEWCCVVLVVVQFTQGVVLARGWYRTLTYMYVMWSQNYLGSIFGETWIETWWRINLKRPKETVGWHSRYNANECNTIEKLHICGWLSGRMIWFIMITNADWWFAIYTLVAK